MNDMSSAVSENSSEATPAPNHFTARQWVVFTAAILAGLIVRWLMLEDRPIHHDESLHGMYGRYFFDFPDHNFYKYDPMLHGPMLYNSMRLVYSTFGSSDFAARVPVALFGTFFMFLPFLFRRFFTSSATVLALTTFIAISPTLVYWSRFLREDYWVLFGLLSMLYGCTLAAERWRATFVLLGLSLNWCTKANIFAHLAVVLGFFVFEYIVLVIREVLNNRKDQLRFDPLVFGVVAISSVSIAILLFLLAHFTFPLADSTVLIPVLGIDAGIRSLRCLALSGAALGIGLLAAFGAATAGWGTMLEKAVANIRKYPAEAGLGACLAFFVYTWFFTAGFRYAEGLFKGFYAGVEYWVHQDSIERIAGPYCFHFYQLSWYESIFVLALLTHLVLFYVRAPLWAQFAAASGTLFFIAAILIGETFVGPIPDWKLARFLKLKDRMDAALAALLAVHSVIVTVYHLLRRERGLAFFGYLFFAIFFTYGKLGEKVPWLSTYPLVAGLLYLPRYFESYFREFPFNYREVPLRMIFISLGMLLMALGFWFIFESVGLSGFRSAFSEGEYRKHLGPMLFENCLFLLIGAALVGLYFFDTSVAPLGRCNLAVTLFVIAVVYNLRATIQTNFLYAGRESEYISQVHTTSDTQEAALRIRREILFETNGYKPKVLVTGEGTWPLTWYFRDLSEYKFSATADEKLQFTYIFQDQKDNPDPGYIPDGYTIRKLNLRGWWVPDLRQMNLKRFLNYALNHNPWSGTGFSTITLLTAKDKARFQQ
jgi:uncharacterized protein (TIGR03663 family)